jgi:hypothetical protein
MLAPLENDLIDAEHLSSNQRVGSSNLSGRDMLFNDIRVLEHLVFSYV